MGPTEVRRGLSHITIVATLAVGAGASAQNALPVWTQERIEAVVRVDISYDGYPRPATSTGFLVKGLQSYYVVATQHGLENEYSAVKLSGAGCVPLVGATLVLTRGEAEPETLGHQHCAILVGMDLALIPVGDRPSGYPTLRMVARSMRKLDVLHLAGYANGYAALDTVSQGPVSQLNVPPDGLGVAHLTTAAGMSGGPYLDKDGEVVAVHRGDIYLSPGYAHFARVEKARVLLEPVLGPIKEETGAGTAIAPVEVAAAAARGARIGDLFALSVLQPSERLKAWSKYQSRTVTAGESALLRRLPRTKAGNGVPTTNLLSKVDVADLIAAARDRTNEGCRTDQRIVDGFVECGGRRVYLPGVRAGTPMVPSLIMLHFAAATNLSGVVKYFTNVDHGVSVHFVIDRDGTLVQLVPANQRAFHAGRGAWNGQRNLNGRAIGIEFMNAGPIKRRDDGTFVTAVGGVTIPENEVLPIKTDGGLAYWHRYTAAQVATAERLAKALAATYPISDVIGHCNVATGKIDPGPAFPIQAFAQAVLGHTGPSCAAQPADSPDNPSE